MLGIFNLTTRLHKSYTDALIIFVPLALVAGAVPWSSNLMFAFNFLAIVSLSGLVRTACEDLSVHLNELLGRLLVAFSDNLVELVVCRTPLANWDFKLTEFRLVSQLLLEARLFLFNRVCWVVFCAILFL